MSTICGHPVAGLVTTEPTGVRVQGAQSPVCAQPACIAEATAWVKRMSRKTTAYHMPAEQKVEVPA